MRSLGPLSACASGQSNIASGAGLCTSIAPPAVVAELVRQHEHWKSVKETMLPAKTRTAFAEGSCKEDSSFCFSNDDNDAHEISTSEKKVIIKSPHRYSHMVTNHVKPFSCGW